MSVWVVSGDLVTAYGIGLDTCWTELLAGRSAVKPMTRFSTAPFQCHCAAILEGLSYQKGTSIVWQMIEKMLVKKDPRIPSDARILLASTTGEVDLMEAAMDEKKVIGSESKLTILLAKTCARLGNDSEGTVISSACSSATVALAQGAGMIERGECDCVAVVACDAVTEFVYSGFASLMALDPDGARPFDAERRGLSVGEAAGFVVLMSEPRAMKEGRKPLGELVGWGMTNDANHMTGPSRDGGALANAIQTALDRAAISADDVSMICAHGTGTNYNDSMELKAFKTIFDDSKPTFSIKGGTGHTMGAAGLVETLLTLEALRNQMVLPTVSLQHPSEDAAGWVSPTPCDLKDPVWALSTNSGFGGVNAALVLRRAAL